MSIPTRQALPPENYLILLGASLCVFSSNNAFVIENILRIDRSNLAWHDLIDLESGQLKPHVARTITKKSGDSSIASLFNEIVSMRNRIIHSLQITAEDGTQVLATKVKRHTSSSASQRISSYHSSSRMKSLATCCTSTGDTNPPRLKCVPPG